MDENILYYLGFSYCSGIGPLRFQQLMEHFKDVKKAYLASKQELSTILWPSIVKNFMDFRNTFDAERELNSFQQQNITVATVDSLQYPPQLLNIKYPPICLYIKGEKNCNNFAEDLYFGVVGTRYPSSYGEYITNQFAGDLADAGFTIVSGMAKGVDAIAHSAAIGKRKKTVAFLGCGVNHAYPFENRKLYHEIITGNGVVISEFPPDMYVDRGLFVARNRLISGLSQGLLVVEGKKTSGALITANCALEQGKDVFAPPVPLNSTNSEAPIFLLKNGAKLVLSVEDILDEYKMQRAAIKTTQIKNLQEEEKLIMQEVAKEPLLANDIGLHLGWPIHKVLTFITLLEIKSALAKNKEGRYEIR